MTRRGWSFWRMRYSSAFGKLIGSGASSLVVLVLQHDAVGGRRVPRAQRRRLSGDADIMETTRMVQGRAAKVLQATFVSLRSVPLRRNHTCWPAGWQTAGAGRKQSTSLRRHTGGVDPKSGSSRLFLDAYHDTQERASLLCGVLRQESIYRAHLTPLAQRSQ